MGFCIAIDGPAGAGKSTIARQVAKRLGYIYVDTGAMYRAMALYFLTQEISLEDNGGIEEECEKARISIEYRENEQVVLLNGENVNHLIRDEKVGNAASVISANKKVRQTLVALQQKLAKEADVVMDGRDIGTCVLPEAEVKIYLTAQVEVRAKRRYDELAAKGMKKDLKKIEEDIRIRDEQDMTRKESPLRQAEDAVLIDSSFMTPAEVEEAVIRLAEEKKK